MGGQKSTFAQTPDRLRQLPPETLVPILQQTLSQGGSFTLVVTGSSMLPTLHSKVDQVELVSPELRQIRRGEMVFFRRTSGEYVLHRVLRCRKGLLLINGDAQQWTESISPEQVIGVVARFTRKGRWVRCDSGVYKAYVALWRLAKPLRPLLFRLRGRK